MNVPMQLFQNRPDVWEVQMAIHGQRVLASCLSGRSKTRRIQVFGDGDGVYEMELSTSTLRLVEEILLEIANGRAVRIVPVHAELTTQEAADLLNVSRPHMVKLLEDGELPFHRTGKHRRIRLDDLMRFKETREKDSEKAMEELSDQAQRLGMRCE
ncbi:helix-turn-helix domain-containing protein [Alcaligenes faecalis]|uniref:helix-turn-helix domain-containing protein n=2 Tax=Alcaligenes faecalis TaxID=511 RepID=UPI0035577348